MKLIEILLAAGVEWPEGSTRAVQGGDGWVFLSNATRLEFRDAEEWSTYGTGRFFDGFGVLELADDYQTAIVTREQYLAAAKEARKATGDATVQICHGVADGLHCHASGRASEPVIHPVSSLSVHHYRREVLIKALEQFVVNENGSMVVATMLGNSGLGYQRRITTAQEMLRELRAGQSGCGND